MAKQYGFYMDTERCIKCWACEVACKQWNGIEAGTIARRKVHEVESGTFPNVTRTFVSMSCMHCGEPACAKVCPAGAITKRGEDGIVVVDKEKCIGCHYCFFACPFGVPQYTDAGMDKCDCCIGNGVEPGDTPNLSDSLSIISKNLFLVSLSSTYLNVSENPFIEVNGVFNSCETFATNSLLMFSNLLISVISSTEITTPIVFFEPLIIGAFLTLNSLSTG